MRVRVENPFNAKGARGARGTQALGVEQPWTRVETQGRGGGGWRARFHAGRIGNADAVEGVPPEEEIQQGRTGWNPSLQEAGMRKG